MSVSSLIFVIEYQGNGAQSAFPIPFYFMALADIEVEINEVVQGYTINYTISGVADNFGAYPNGGTVNTVVPVPSGQTITITRNTAKTSIWSFVDGQPLTADAINHSLDRLLLIDQEEAGVTNVVTSAPIVPIAVIGGPLTLIAGNQWTVVNAQASNAGPCIVNLPPATGSQNLYYIKKTDTNPYPVAVTPAGLDTIDGAAGSDLVQIAQAANLYQDFGTGTWLKL